MSNAVMLSAILIGAFCCNCMIPSDLFADYYKYTDNRGVISITNKRDSVPAKYRSTMKVMREEPKADAGLGGQVPEPQPAAAIPPGQAADAAPEPGLAAGKFAELSSRFVWFKPLVYLGVLLALTVIIIKLASLISSPLLSKLIYLCFFLGVFVFIYKSYVAHVVESSTKIKNDAVSVIKNSMQREESLSPGAPP